MIKRRSNPRISARGGNIVIFAAILMMLMFGALAISIDMGPAYVNRTKSQRSADAASIAAANQHLEQQRFNPLVYRSSPEAQASAVQFVAFNNVGSVYPALPNDDVTIGHLGDLSNPSAPIELGGLSYNIGRARVQRTEAINGQTPFFFAPVLGFDAMSLVAEGTAGYVSAFRGFTSPSNGENLGILPFALDKQTCDDLQAGLMQDNWMRDANGQVLAGADGIQECNLYPQGTGMPGKRVMVQPAPMTTLAGIPGDDATQTMFIYSPVKLIR